MKSTAVKIKIVILGALFALHGLYAVAANPPAHFSLDEGVYATMTRSLAESGSLSVWNGYGEHPSPELVYLMMREDARDPQNPRLVPQYPAVYAAIGYPFYKAAGFKGLQIMNLLAFLATVGFCVALARRLFDDANLAFNAGLMLVLGGFTWEYAHGAWPHALSMLAVTMAIWFAVSAIRADGDRAALPAALAVGLIAGIGAGLRYDTILVIPAMALPFLFASPVRLLPPVAIVVGAIPGLAALSVTNFLKFGSASPFTYGFASTTGPVSVSSYGPLVLAAGAVLLALWAATRRRAWKTVRERPWIVLAAVAALFGAAMLIPQIRALAYRMLNGVWQLVVDIRVRDLGIVEDGVDRTASGAVVYGVSLKKALLQSCPWLVVLVLPFIEFVRGRKQSAEFALLFLVIAGFVSFYGYFAWHGGFAFNMRYFLPLLPVAAILGAWSWRALSADLKPLWRNLMAGGGIATLLFWVRLVPADLDVADQAPVLLSLPLYMAAVLLAFLIAGAVPWRLARPAVNAGALAMFAVSLTWAANVGLVYDLLRSYKARSYNYQFTQDVDSVIAADSILFAERFGLYPGVFEAERVRLALPAQDDFHDFRALVDMHLAAGRPVYGVFEKETWEKIRADGLLDGLEVAPLMEREFEQIAQIRRSTTASASNSD